ncbi:MAG: rod shape-determining protein MreC [Arenicella sp.]|jgi:rod shape-determining protein MreC
MGLQLLCAWLIVNRNSYQNFAYLSSSSRVMGEVYTVTGSVESYFNLTEVNKQLMAENARLRKQRDKENSIATFFNDSTLNSFQNDTTFFSSYSYIPAQVINNSIRLDDNYLTLDKGTKDGIEPGMGVITSNGIVGKVKACSEHFSSVYSVLHSSMLVASELKKSKSLCSTKWNTKDYSTANLLYLSRQSLLKAGDTVVTAGNNSIFPPNMMIGTISTFEKLKSESFMQAEIKLSTDFSKLDYVYIVKNKFSAEKDSLEMDTQ